MNFLRHELEKAFGDVLDAMLQTSDQKRIELSVSDSFKVKAYVLTDDTYAKSFRVDVTIKKAQLPVS